jgi:predicted phosphodiesterase
VADAGRRRSVLTQAAVWIAAAWPSRTALQRAAGALVKTLCVAVLALPLAAAWGIGHARVEDYLGPHQATFAANYSGEIKLELGPIGNAYLPSPAAPIGLGITVGAVGGQPAESLTTLFSDKTLAAYAGLYTEPSEAVTGVVERLQIDALVRGLWAEAVLLALFAVWALRRLFWSEWLARELSGRRLLVAYLAITALVFGSILVPPTADGARIPVAVANRTRFAGLTVDSVLLADLLNRGLKGTRLLTERQQRRVRTYIDKTNASLARQSTRLPRPRAGETMIMGFSDLHCNRAATELITRLERATSPAVVLSSGDDTLNGAAVERGCIRREAKITERAPFVVAGGNHDSEVTEAQMKSDGIAVLDGAVLEAGPVQVLGDDDPEYNNLSGEQISDRQETEEQVAERLVEVARGRRVDVILVHKPVAATVIMKTPNPPARLVLWGHLHAEQGPSVIMHKDGSWTVGMQQGTAGGVRVDFTYLGTPFSPPLISADVYFYFRDDATGLITGVQPVHFLPEAKTVIEKRIPTGDLAKLPAETRIELGGGTPSPSPTTTPAR